MPIVVAMSAASESMKAHRAVRLIVCAAFSFVGVCVATAFADHAVVLVVGVVSLAVALLGTSPVAMRFWRRRLRIVGPPSRALFDVTANALAATGLGFVPVQRGDDLCHLTDEQLCAAWHRSTVALGECSPPRLKYIAAQRQRYLDEFERRNPKGLKVWLASSDTLSGDPRAFLVEGWADLPAVDWDELTGGPGA